MRIHQWLLILCTLKSVSSVDLECEYIQWDSLNDIGSSCVLKKKEPISSSMEKQKFKFTGLAEYQINKIQTICFQTSRISFVPKETVKFFPNLDGIAIIDTNLRIIEYDWLENLLKFVKNQTRNLYFHENKIEMIDPAVFPIFQKMDRVFLRGNLCIKEGFPISRDPAIMKFELQNCFENYENSRATFTLFQKFNETINRRFEAIELQLKQTNITLNNRLDKIEKTLDKILGKIRDANKS